MKLSELSIEGFGKLVNRQFHFGPGLNLIVGPNEAGKSTLQQTILSMLYGFFDEGNVTDIKRQMKDNFKPWDNQARYTGSLTYSLENGESYCVKRKFDPTVTTKLSSLPGGKDVSDQYKRSSNGRNYFADKQLGISKDVFENTCYVRQADLVSMQKSARAITETLMRLSTSASSDMTTLSALKSLEFVLKEQIGTPRSSTKPLRKAKEKLENLVKERNNILEQRQQLFADLIELRQYETSLQELETKQEQLEYLHSLAESNSLREKCEITSATAAEIKEWLDEQAKWQSWATFPAHLKKVVDILSAQWHCLRTEQQKYSESVKNNREELSPLLERIAILEADNALQTDAERLSDDDKAAIEILIEQRRRAVDSINEAEERFIEASNKVRDIESELTEKSAALGPSINLGLSGLTVLQLTLRNAQKTLADAQQERNQSEGDLIVAGIDESLITDLQTIIAELKADKALSNYTHPTITSLSAFAGFQQSNGIVLRIESEIKIAQYLQLLAEISNYRKRLAAINEIDKTLKHCLEEVTRWRNWAQFPISLRDNLIRLEANRNAITAELVTVQRTADKAQKTLDSINPQIAEIITKISAVENSRNTPTEKLPYIQELATKLRIASETGRGAQDRYQKAEVAMQEVARQVEAEYAKLKSIIELGSSGIAKLKDEWQFAKQQVLDANNKFQTAQAEWLRVGMSENQFKELADTVEQINFGKKQSPVPRMGCTGFLLKFKSVQEDKTPTEVTLYAQLKPIFAEFQSAKAESDRHNLSLQNIEYKIKEQLQVDDQDGRPLNEGLFTSLEYKLENYQQLASTLEGKKSLLPTLQVEMQNAETQYKGHSLALETELNSYGYNLPDLFQAYTLFVENCRSRTQLEQEEAKLSPLKLRAQEQLTYISNLKTKRDALTELETELKQILNQAGIETVSNDIETGLEQFNQGVANYGKYIEAVHSVENVKKSDHYLSDSQQSTNLETSLVDAETRATALQAEHPEWIELQPAKTASEYATIVRDLDSQWRNAHSNYIHNKELLIKAIDGLQQLYNRAVTAGSKVTKAVLDLADTETNIHQQLEIATSAEPTDDLIIRLSGELEEYMRLQGNNQKAFAEQLLEDWNKKKDSLATLSQELQDRLKMLSIDNDDLPTALDQFAILCARKKSLEDNKNEIKDLILQSQPLQSSVTQYDLKSGELVNISANLADKLSHAGIDTTNLDGALEKFNEGFENNKRWLEANSKYITAIEKQQLISSSITLSNQETSLTAIEAEIDKLRSNHPEWQNLVAEKTAHDYSVDLQNVNGDYSTAIQEYNKLRDSITNNTNLIKHPAEIDEDIILARVEVRRLELISDALEMAMSELEKATLEYQKEFAPKLEGIINEGISLVTNDRYNYVTVSPSDLSVTLKVADNKDEVPVEVLSAGTQDLIYLMLRVGIVKLISSNEERLPLLLDDPFTHFDAERQIKALEFISQLAIETQVFLFTKDQVIKKWFEEKFSHSQEHKIYNLAL